MGNATESDGVRANLCGVRVSLHGLAGANLAVAFNMGTVKPAVLPKRVPQVWVRSRFLAHRDTPHTCGTVTHECIKVRLSLIFYVLN